MLTLTEQRELEVQGRREAAAEWAATCRRGGSFVMAAQYERDDAERIGAIAAMDDEAYAAYRAAKAVETARTFEVITTPTPAPTRRYATREMEIAA